MKPRARSTHRPLAQAFLALVPAGALLAALAASPAAAAVSGYEVKLPPAAKAGDLTPFQPCTFRGLRSRGTDAALCATYVVAENPKKPTGRLLALPVVKLPALGAAKPDALFYFAGGPGGSNLSYPLDARGVFESQDIYMLGYRGVDDPNPLRCPEIDKATAGPRILSDETAALIADASRQCAARLTASGVDLSQYTMVNVIRDHEGVRKALGLAKVNLMGVSYGTRLEQYYPRLYPTSVRRSVQLAVNPPGHFRWYPQATDELLGEYAKLCAADAKCAARTSDLARSVRQTLARDDVSWNGKLIDMDKARLGAFSMLMSKSAIVALFDAVLAAEKGDNSGLARIAAMVDASVAHGLLWGDTLSKGGVEHQPPAARAYRQERRSTATSFGSPMDLIFQAACKDWPVQPLPKGFDKAAEDKTPTLLINGNLDITTPLKFVRDELLPHLPNGRLVVLSNQSHGDWEEEQKPAMDRLISGFLKDGAVDDSGFVTTPVPFR